MNRAALLACISILLSVRAAMSFNDTPAVPPTDLAGSAIDPLASRGTVQVLLFVRTDCPITNRYAPELRRIAAEFHDVKFWLVYPDRSSTAAEIREHVAQYQFPGTPVRDPAQVLVTRAHAEIAPEAAVFSVQGNEVYHGRIDDRWVDFGKARVEAQTHDLEDALRNAIAGRPIAHASTRAVGCSLADLR
jgi:hypothetical protein